MIDPTTHSVIENITVGNGPNSIGTIIFDNKPSIMYVLNTRSNSMSVIDPTTQLSLMANLQ